VLAAEVGSVAAEHQFANAVSGHYERQRRRVYLGERAAKPDIRDPKPQRQSRPWQARLA
jgi:hypothetical protein